MPKVKFGTFTLEAPPNWTLNSVILAGPVDEAPPGAGMLTTKAVQPFQRNVITTLEQVGPGETAEGYVAAQQRGLDAENVGRKETRPPEKVKVGGLDGLLTEQTISGMGGERVRQMQLVVIKNGVAHTTIATHLDGISFENVREEFRAMLLSFE